MGLPLTFFQLDFNACGHGQLLHTDCGPAGKLQTSARVTPLARRTITCSLLALPLVFLAAVFLAGGFLLVVSFALGEGISCFPCGTHTREGCVWKQ
jgi:hypothetical protein